MRTLIAIACFAVLAMATPAFAQGNTQSQGSMQGMDHSRMQGMD
ncbi:hypothetical protein SAMN02745194_04934, partial [Roseomonas rosea]